MDSPIIRYDTFKITSVNSRISFEDKEIVINCPDTHNLAQMSTLLDLDKISWMKENAQLINLYYSERFNFEISLKRKIKYLSNSSEYIKKEIRQFNIFDVVQNKFESVDKFEWDSHLIDILKLLFQEKIEPNLDISSFKEVLFNPQLVNEIIKKIIINFSFENLSGQSGSFNLSDIGQKIFNESLRIQIIPTEKIDDEGYKQEKVTIIDKGRIKKIFCLNINKELNDHCISGYIELDEFRNKKISVNKILLETKAIDTLAYKFENVCDAISYKVVGYRSIIITVSSALGQIGNINFEIKEFLENLTYIKNTNQYMLVRQ